MMTRYPVREPDGEVIAVHVRSDGPDGKRMSWELADGTIGLNGQPTADLPLYGAHLAATWDRSRVVVLAEGEKAADKLIDAGFQAAGTVTGAASTPSLASLEILRGYRVVLWPDADDAGRKHMARIAERLGPIAATVALVTWPDAPPGGDAADVGEADAIGALIDGAEPLLSPEARLRAVIDQQVPEFRERLSRALQIVDKQPTPNGGPAALRFYTMSELANLTLPVPDWIAHGFLALQAITEIDGKIKKAGKTTFALLLVRAVLEGTSFLGIPIRKAKVIYVTEQSRQTFMDAARRAGLAEWPSDELKVLFREDLKGRTWASVVAEVTETAVAGGYELIVIDTIGKLAGIVNENDAGEWSAAMIPLQDLAAANRAVLIARHDRKSGGEVGESGRGSSQASGDVDIILQLRRPEGNQPTTRRVLESASRYPDTPEKVVIELTDEGYAMLGVAEAVATSDARHVVVAALGRELQQDDSGLTQKALVELGAAHEPPVTRWAIQQALDELVESGEVSVSGKARSRTNPLTYRLADRLAATPTLGVGVTATQLAESEDDLLGQLRMEEP